MSKRHIIGLIKAKTLRLLMGIDGISLTKKFFIAYLIIFAIPIVLFGWWFTSNMMQNAQKEELSRSTENIRQIQSDVQKNIELCRNAGQAALSTKNFLGIISSYQQYSTAEILDFKNDILFNVENILNINTSINNLRVYINNKNISEIYPSLRYESLIINEPWYKNLFEKGVTNYWRLNHPEDDFKGGILNSREVVSVYRKVTNDNKHIGILEVNMLAEEFFGNIYSNLENHNKFIVIINGENEQYYNSKSDFINRFGLETDMLKSQLIKNSQKEEGFFKISSNNLEFNVTYTYVQKMDSYIYQMVSLNETNQYFKKIQTEAILIIILILAAFSIVTYIITKILLKKMNTIVAYMRRVQEGEMFVDIPIQGNDEIGELSRHFQIMLNKINELIFSVVRKQSIAKEAEIKALHSQINAHFIYNVLETVKMMAVVDYKYEISDALTELGRLMRYSMNWEKQYVPLKDEIKYIKDYIKLLNLRFKNKIELNIKIEDDLLEYQILKMLLQPVVENAVNHGLEPKGINGKIKINIFVEETILFINIIDDGVGMNVERLESLRRSLAQRKIDENQSIKGNGIALGNVNERIKIYYGEEFGLSVESQEEAFTSVYINLPYKPVEG